jgi:hypothetical protein
MNDRLCKNEECINYFYPKDEEIQKEIENPQTDQF